MNVFYIFLLYARLLVGGVVEETGAWTFTCQSHDATGRLVFTIESGRWQDGVDAAYIAVPSGIDEALLCYAEVPGESHRMYFAPAELWDHDRRTDVAMPLYLTEARSWHREGIAYAERVFGLTARICAPRPWWAWEHDVYCLATQDIAYEYMPLDSPDLPHVYVAHMPDEWRVDSWTHHGSSAKLLPHKVYLPVIESSN